MADSLEVFAARKLGSKITRALFSLDEAMQTAHALGQERLRLMSVPHLRPAMKAIVDQLRALRDGIRFAVPATAGIAAEDQREQALADPLVIERDQVWRKTLRAYWERAGQSVPLCAGRCCDELRVLMGEPPPSTEQPLVEVKSG